MYSMLGLSTAVKVLRNLRSNMNGSSNVNTIMYSVLQQ